MPKNNKLYHRHFIIAGLAIFVIIIAFPVFYNMGKAAPAPELKLTEKAQKAKFCIQPTDYMRKEHMQILDVWRDTVVREGKRKYLNAQGKEFEMSLSNTCLDCHSNKAEFCDKCHNYASVDPYCWDCHIDNPKEKDWGTK